MAVPSSRATKAVPSSRATKADPSSRAAYLAKLRQLTVPFRLAAASVFLQATVPTQHWFRLAAGL